jgi:DNA invertase Pin-like site-specific DNA recombinase
MEALEEKGVDFVSLTEGIDTTTAQGKLTSRVLRGTS